MLFARSRGEKPNIKSNLCFNEGGLSPAPERLLVLGICFLLKKYHLREADKNGSVVSNYQGSIPPDTLILSINERSPDVQPSFHLSQNQFQTF